MENGKVYKSNNPKKRGFTLIELLVVISIIALLLSIILPSLQKAKEMAKKTVCLSHIKTLALTTILYAQHNDDHLPQVVRAGLFDSDGAGNYYTYFEHPSWGADAGPIGLGYLVTSGLIENNSEIMFCPSARKLMGSLPPADWNCQGNNNHWNYVGPGATHGSQGDLIPKDACLGWMNQRVSYSMRPLDSTEMNIKKLSKARTISYISDIWMALGPPFWLSHISDMGHAPRNLAYGQLNVAYTDGHVENKKLQKDKFFYPVGHQYEGYLIFGGEVTWKTMLDN